MAGSLVEIQALRQTRWNNLWLREKESNLHLRVQSPTCCRLHHPAKRHGVSGHWDSNPEPGANLALTPLIRRLLYRIELYPVEFSDGCPFRMLMVGDPGIEPGASPTPRERSTIEPVPDLTHPYFESSDTKILISFLTSRKILSVAAGTVLIPG